MHQNTMLFILIELVKTKTFILKFYWLLNVYPLKKKSRLVKEFIYTRKLFVQN